MDEHTVWSHIGRAVRRVQYDFKLCASPNISRIVQFKRLINFLFYILITKPAFRIFIFIHWLRTLWRISCDVISLTKHTSISKTLHFRDNNMQVVVFNKSSSKLYHFDSIERIQKAKRISDCVFVMHNCSLR